MIVVRLKSDSPSTQRHTLLLNLYIPLYPDQFRQISYIRMIHRILHPIYIFTLPIYNTSFVSNHHLNSISHITLIKDSPESITTSPPFSAFGPI